MLSNRLDMPSRRDGEGNYERPGLNYELIERPCNAFYLGLKITAVLLSVESFK
jgi:hypothetical protein